MPQGETLGTSVQLSYNNTMQRKKDSERRQQTRVDFSKLPWVFCLRADDFSTAKTPTRIEACDISVSGIRMRSNRRIDIFTDFDFQLLHKEKNIAPIEISAKVVRVEETDLGLEEKTYTIAAEFNNDTASESKQFIFDIKNALNAD